MADGCGWGHRSREAASRAVDALSAHIDQKYHSFRTVQDVGRELLVGLQTAHVSIVSDKRNTWEAGTTTLAGGLLVQIESAKTPAWLFVCVSVGDCKAYHYHSSSRKLTDITHGNRESNDPTDPNGRLGPYVEPGEPDYRNLDIYHSHCKENDFIFIVSDGVHDNFDPQTLGKTPGDIGLSVDTWDFSSLQDTRLQRRCYAVRNRFMLTRLRNVIEGASGRSFDEAVATFDTSSLTPDLITSRIMNYVWLTTKKSRQFMESNVHEKLPSDFSCFPGKLDHTTCVCFRVCELASSGASVPSDAH